MVKTTWSPTAGLTALHQSRRTARTCASTKPIHQQPYRAGPTAREHQRKEIDRILQAVVIEPATSEWASLVVLLPKKDKTLRFCVDYRKLNTVTQRDSYPLPRMYECIDFLGDATIFTRLDCNSGIGRSRSTKKIAIRPPLPVMVGSSGFYVCRSVWKTRPHPPRGP